MSLAYADQTRNPGDATWHLRALRFYFDLILTLLTVFRVLLAPRGRPLALGFFVNKVDGKFLPRAACPGATFIRINYPRRQRGWDAARFAWLLNLLARITARRQVQAIIWGYRDRTHHGIDSGHYFADYCRVERALVRPPGNANTSFIIDAKSIYFDGRVSTDLERRLNGLAPGELPRSDAGRRILDHVLNANLTKYALGRVEDAPPARRVEDTQVSANDLLIVGQCTGDQAITETAALGRTNPELVRLAADHLMAKGRYAKTYFKAHPKNSTTPADLAYLRQHHPDIAVIDGNTSIIPLLAARPAVATLTSGVGLEAAIRGCEVHTFGISFYSNWGFTVDRLPCPRRTNRLSPQDVFLHMLMQQTKYVDGKTGRPVPAVAAFGLARAEPL